MCQGDNNQTNEDEENQKKKQPKTMIWKASSTCAIRLGSLLMASLSRVLKVVRLLTTNVQWKLFHAYSGRKQHKSMLHKSIESSVKKKKNASTCTNLKVYINMHMKSYYIPKGCKNKILSSSSRRFVKILEKRILGQI